MPSCCGFVQKRHADQHMGNLASVGSVREASCTTHFTGLFRAWPPSELTDYATDPLSLSLSEHGMNNSDLVYPSAAVLLT